MHHFQNMNLIIRGQVLNGYKVNCGGNLHIVKSVEDNVNIVCNGNLDVDWGITGKNTEVQCSKNLNAGFVEKSTVICDGDIEIKVTNRLRVSGLYEYNFLDNIRVQRGLGFNYKADCWAIESRVIEKTNVGNENDLNWELNINLFGLGEFGI